MVALQILVLSVEVRILLSQPKYLSTSEESGVFLHLVFCVSILNTFDAFLFLTYHSLDENIFI